MSEKREIPIEWMNHETTEEAQKLEAEWKNGDMPPPIEGPGAIIHRHELAAAAAARRRKECGWN